MSHPTPTSIDPVETLSETELSEHQAHASPFWSMFWVFVVLLVLTALTVWSSNIHEFQFGNTLIEFGGTAHIVLAMTIAVIKSVLVAAFFMHLLYDKPMNTVVVGATLFAACLFIGFTLADSATRKIYAPTESTVIMPGGTKRVVETARTNAAQATSNPAPTDETKPAPGGGH